MRVNIAPKSPICPKSKWQNMLKQFWPFLHCFCDIALVHGLILVQSQKVLKLIGLRVWAHQLLKM